MTIAKLKTSLSFLIDASLQSFDHKTIWNEEIVAILSDEPIKLNGGLACIFMSSKGQLFFRLTPPADNHLWMDFL